MQLYFEKLQMLGYLNSTEKEIFLPLLEMRQKKKLTQKKKVERKVERMVEYLAEKTDASSVD